MRSHELTLGRTFAVVLDHGDDFYSALTEFCDTHHIRQGYLQFIAGFSHADIVGTCDTLDNPDAPLWTKVHLTNVEVLGSGTLAHDPHTHQIRPHIHITAGLKQHSATGHTSHLLNATVQFLTEMIVHEITHPAITRTPEPDLYDVPLLRFAPGTPQQAEQPE